MRVRNYVPKWNDFTFPFDKLISFHLFGFNMNFEDYTKVFSLHRNGEIINPSDRTSKLLQDLIRLSLIFQTTGKLTVVCQSVNSPLCKC